VGLLWEKLISKNEKSASTTNNGKLKKFIISDKRIKYYATNAGDIAEKKVAVDEIYFTNTDKNIVSSLMKHLRNSIMHGEYSILNNEKGDFVEFRDRNKGKTTMTGKIYINTLKQLVACLNE